MKMTRSSGFAGYAFITLWFLIMWMAPARADAQTSVSAADILPTIEAALMARCASADVRVEIEKPQVAITLDENGEARFDSVSYNPSSGRFLIRAKSLSGGAPSVIAGRASSPVRLPVLAQGIARDAVITENDIVWVETTGVNASLYIGDPVALVGMSARRDLKPGQPLRSTDVAAPIAFKRGDIITMIIEAPGMRLSHRGIAMETGAIGDLVDVKNAASERIVKGIVVDRNVVRIPGPADMRAQQFSMLKD